MPIYAFECAACGHDFDRLQKLSDADPTDCPACGRPELRRQLTAPQFRLSGTGWYETDFKKDGDTKRNLAGDGAAPEAPSRDAETRPAEARSAEARSAEARSAEAKANPTAPATPTPAKPAPAAGG